MLKIVHGAQETRHFPATQDHGEFLFLLGEGDVLDRPFLPQTDPVQEA